MDRKQAGSGMNGKALTRGWGIPYDVPDAAKSASGFDSPYTWRTPRLCLAVFLRPIITGARRPVTNIPSDWAALRVGAKARRFQVSGLSTHATPPFLRFERNGA